ISSWHIQYSRLAWESNVGILLFTLGFFFFLKGLKKNFYLIFSALAFALGLFTYHTFKVFVILFVLGLIIIYLKKLIVIKKSILFPVIIFGILVTLII